MTAEQGADQSTLVDAPEGAVSPTVMPQSGVDGVMLQCTRCAPSLAQSWWWAQSQSADFELARDASG
jgi:hypothetical protein